MTIHFRKYQGTGNDFILLDNRENLYNALSLAQIKFLCDRHFGIGADGLMLLNASADFDFEMKYYNSDGNESSMCGNGGRCITAFAKELGIISSKAVFKAIDGRHESVIDAQGIVRLNMNAVNGIQVNETYTELNTGSPHYVHFTDYVDEMDMKLEGKLIRYSPKYKDEGINVNFVEKLSDSSIYVRTYERGVEDETLSCGTGVTASAIAFKVNEGGPQHVKVKTLGGDLEVFFTMENKNAVHSVLLCGKAEFVFQGKMII